jgi:hypothetical protein
VFAGRRWRAQFAFEPSRNQAVAPDIDVENSPKDIIARHDPQLERALEEAMKQ